MSREEQILRCKRCAHAITSVRERIEVEGRHAHVFVNPSAIEFRLGCFRSAGGCALVGEESTFWSWFRGYAWTVAVCAQCGAHLGWGFSGESRFFGLILDRLGQ